MSESILDPRETSYILKKAELVKTYRQIDESVLALINDLTGKEEPKSNMVHAHAGKELKIDISLDKLTIERFNIIIPYFKKHLEEYHLLRSRQRELESELKEEQRPDFMDVIDTKDIETV